MRSPLVTGVLTCVFRSALNGRAGTIAAITSMTGVRMNAPSAPSANGISAVVAREKTKKISANSENHNTMRHRWGFTVLRPLPQVVCRPIVPYDRNLPHVRAILPVRVDTAGGESQY